MFIEPVSLVYLVLGFTFIIVGALISANIVPPKAGSKLTAQLYYCFGFLYSTLFLAGYNKDKGNYLDVSHYPYTAYLLLIFFSIGFRTLTRYAGFISHQSRLESISKGLCSFLIAAIIAAALATPYFFADRFLLLHLVAGLTGLSMLLQCILCLKIIHENSQRIVHFYADSEQVSLRWLAWTILLFIGLGVNLLISPWIRPYLDQIELYGRSAFTSANPVSGLAIILFGFLAIKMLSQEQIHSDVMETAEAVQDTSNLPEQINPEASTTGTNIKERTGSSGTKPVRANVLLDPQTMEDYWQKITSVMDSSQPYLMHGFSVAQLAGLTNIKRNQLSFTINAKSGHVFQEFVNNYRVAHAITMLKDPKYSALPIKSIMLESGFRSSSVFHANFRRVTGVSPLKFREQLIIV